MSSTISIIAITVAGMSLLISLWQATVNWWRFRAERQARIAIDPGDWGLDGDFWTVELYLTNVGRSHARHVCVWLVDEHGRCAVTKRERLPKPLLSGGEGQRVVLRVQRNDTRFTVWPVRSWRDAREEEKDWEDRSKQRIELKFPLDRHDERLASSRKEHGSTETSVRSTDLVRLAREIAERAHANQTDKAGKPYITHLGRVAGAVVGDEAKATALLHDVLEDTDVSADELEAKGVPRRVIAAVEHLTKREGDDYVGFIDRIVASGDQLALTVKLADLRDNLSRPESLGDRGQRYEQAVARIESALAPYERER